MTKVKIKTLTPVHIGSGKELMKNTEFISVQDEIGVVDDKKVIKIIGIENVDTWVSIINNGGSLWEYLKQRKPNVKLEDVSSRILPVYCNSLHNKRSLKEQLHSAKQFPLIPGSSIKGAIRTAVISDLVKRNQIKVKAIIDKQIEAIKKPYSKWSDREFHFLESAIVNQLLSGDFRSNANQNIFRFLQISDATFDSSTIVSNVQVANYQREEWGTKKGTDQLVELIDIESESYFRLKINQKLLSLNKEHRIIKTESYFLSSTEDLFEIINNHTKELVKKELDFWNEESVFEEKIETYLENLKAIYDYAVKCEKNEAVLRIGGNIGWDSITGAWIKNCKTLLNNDEWETLYKNLNKSRNVDFFPKTRKIDEDGFMTGFVCLTI